MVSQGFQEPLKPHKSADGTAIEAETEKLEGRTLETMRLVGVLLFAGSVAGMLGFRGPTRVSHGAAHSVPICWWPRASPPLICGSPWGDTHHLHRLHEPRSAAEGF